MPDEDRGLTSRIGPVEVDWPRSVGYYGGVTLAVGLGMIEWPVGLFIAGIPVVKLLNRSVLPRAVRFGVQAFEGMAKPVGGDSEGTIRLTKTPRRLQVASQRAVGQTSRRRPARRPAAARPARSAPKRQQRTQAVTGREEA